MESTNMLPPPKSARIEKLLHAPQNIYRVEDDREDTLMPHMIIAFASTIVKDPRAFNAAWLPWMDRGLARGGAAAVVGGSQSTPPYVTESKDAGAGDTSSSLYLHCWMLISAGEPATRWNREPHTNGRQHELEAPV
ncbi:hypothetical protein FRC06_001292 [Ceratobasidium sp. 370]|nr:hypothetical protein FRC06_001292 [Ceratobasidium sp. 370]